MDPSDGLLESLRQTGEENVIGLASSAAAAHPLSLLLHEVLKTGPG
jgi:hypothetical protein